MRRKLYESVAEKPSEQLQEQVCDGSNVTEGRVRNRRRDAVPRVRFGGDLKRIPRKSQRPENQIIG